MQLISEKKFDLCQFMIDSFAQKYNLLKINTVTAYLAFPMQIQRERDRKCKNGQTFYFRFKFQL